MSTNKPEADAADDLLDDGERCSVCGETLIWERCDHCDDGYDGHDCGEDTCCCLHPEENRACTICRGAGGFWTACACERRAG